MMQSSGRIYIRLPNWVGDVVLVTPALHNLRRAYPDAELIGVGKSFCRDILESNGDLDGFLEISGKAFRKDVKKVRDSGPGAGLLFTNSLGTAVQYFLAGLRPRVGYANEGRSLFLHHSIKRPRVSMDEYYLRLAEFAGAKRLRTELKLEVHPESVALADSFLKSYGLNQDAVLVGLNPGAGTSVTKRWPTQYFIQLAKALLAKVPNARFLVFAGPGEENLGQELLDGIGTTAIGVFLTRPGLNHIRAYIKRLKAFITNDSGLRWYGAAYNIPMTVIYGPTDQSLTDCHNHSSISLQNKVDCAPCKHKICPFAHECMRGLDPETVLNSVLQQLLY